MALTEEQLKLQMEILASKTDSSTNPNMVYKSNAALNKGLNPEFFTGNGTKIVNAINSLAAKSEQCIINNQTIMDKVNSILLDVDMTDNAVLWEETKELMEKDTIIEGIKNILEGNLADKILGFDIDDTGKILAIDTNEEGNAVVKAVDMPSSQEVTAIGIPYTNQNVPTVKNVKSALDYVILQILSGNTGGGLEGDLILGDITWDMILDKPVVGSRLSLISNRLALLDSEGTIISSINLTTDKEIDEMIESMDN